MRLDCPVLPARQIVVVLDLEQLDLRTHRLKIGAQTRCLGFRAGFRELRNHDSCQDAQDDYDGQNEQDYN